MENGWILRISLSCRFPQQKCNANLPCTWNWCLVRQWLKILSKASTIEGHFWKINLIPLGTWRRTTARLSYLWDNFFSTNDICVEQNIRGRMNRYPWKGSDWLLAHRTLGMMKESSVPHLRKKMEICLHMFVIVKRILCKFPWWILSATLSFLLKSIILLS
jgi:hypothetical protein